MREKSLQSLLYWLCWVIVIGLGLYVLFTLIGDNKDEIDKAYVLTENAIQIKNKKTNEKIKILDLSISEEGIMLPFSPHSIAVTSDKKYAWVTITRTPEQQNDINTLLKGKTDEHVHLLTATDQVILINMLTDTVDKRIPLGVNLGIAHGILTLDNSFLYVSAEKGNAVYKINTKTSKVDTLIQLSIDSKPHDIGIADTSQKLFVRSKDDKNIYSFTSSNDIVKVEQLPENKIRWSSH